MNPSKNNIWILVWVASLIMIFEVEIRSIGHLELVNDIFPLMFLPLGVSDRVTDILRGYIATAGIWAMGFSVAYASPIFYQKRNFHNLHNDFQQEMPLYANAESWRRLLSEIKMDGAAEFYRMAIRLLEAQGVISADNSVAYELFLRTMGLV